jgi:hypothetical protein
MSKPAEHGNSPAHEKARRGQSRRGRSSEHHLCPSVYDMFSNKSSPDAAARIDSNVDTAQ